jgi:hypothetical protein
LGVPVAPRKSTLAYANEKRPWELYQTVFEQTLVKCQELVSSQGGRKKFRFKNKLRSLNGSTIDLSSMFDWAKFRRTKGAKRRGASRLRVEIFPTFLRWVDEGMAGFG